MFKTPDITYCYLQIVIFIMIKIGSGSICICVSSVSNVSVSSVMATGEAEHVQMKFVKYHFSMFNYCIVSCLKWTKEWAIFAFKTTDMENAVQKRERRWPREWLKFNSARHGVKHEMSVWRTLEWPTHVFFHLGTLAVNQDFRKIHKTWQTRRTQP